MFAETALRSPRTGSDAFVATKNDGGALPPRGFVGRLGACPFANADGAIPLQMSDAGVLRLRGAQPLTPTRAGVVVFTGVADDLSISALTPRFVAAGLGAPWQVADLENTLRVTFRGGDADASGRDDAVRASRRRRAQAARFGTRVQADLATKYARRPRRRRRARPRPRARTARGGHREPPPRRGKRRRGGETTAVGNGKRSAPGSRFCSAAARERRRVAAAFLKKRERWVPRYPRDARGMCPHRAETRPRRDASSRD